MNTKLLKQKILDLAIRGKLTQQLKSDGTAADLLKEISSACHPERSAKGAKSKDLKQIIPLDKSEAPFEIPENWEWVHLQDVGELSRGKSKHRPRNDPALYVDGFMPFVQTGDVAGAEKGLICKWHSLYMNSALPKAVFGLEEQFV
jgi:type I restriction enzyme S subunit